MIHDDGSNVLFELWRLGRAASALLADDLADAGLSSDEFGIYSVLASVDSMSPTALARWISAPATTMSSHLKRLEARGHIVRRADPADRRGYLFELTPGGRDTFERATAIYAPILSRVQQHLGKREPSVRRALITLRQAVDQSRSQVLSP